MKQIVPGLSALAFLYCAAAPAHHSPARFDLSQDATLEGIVTEFSWRNPHVYIELQMPGPDGEDVIQRIEAGPASNFVPLGVDGDSVSAGERVSIHVKPNRRGAGHTALGWLLTKADGQKIPLHVRAIPLAAPSEATASSLAGTWVPQGAGFAELAVAARAWPLTAAGRAAVQATADARDVSRSQCVPFGPPALMTLPSTIVIEETDDEITVRLDVMDAQRTIHLNVDDVPAGTQPSLHGFSIGHFEDETLVVETSHYAAHPDGYAFDLPSSADKTIVERFALSEDRRHLNYEATVTDLTYFAEPVTHRAQWDYRPEQQMSNLPCDPDVAGQFVND